jgi:periplasmic protein TonB
MASAPSDATRPGTPGVLTESGAGPTSHAMTGAPPAAHGPASGGAGEGNAIVADPQPDGSGAGVGRDAVTRLAPGDAGSASAPDGAIPPEYDAYVRALRQRIQDRLIYPWTAVRRRQQGIVELEMRVGPDGRLVAVEVVGGQGAEALRTAALAAVQGSAPFPFPPGLAARPLVIRLPVEFRLR